MALCSHTLLIFVESYEARSENYNRLTGDTS